MIHKALSYAGKVWEFSTHATGNTEALWTRDGGNIVIAFRATDSFSDWIDNFSTGSIYRAYAGCKVHRRTAGEVEHILEKIPLDKDQKYLVTGHSKGGRAAWLAFMNLEARGYSVTGYAFGAPKVGPNSKEERGFVFYENALDIAPHWPWWWKNNKPSIKLKSIGHSLNEYSEGAL